MLISDVFEFPGNCGLHVSFLLQTENAQVISKFQFPSQIMYFLIERGVRV
jgi:hypothetical protein